MFVPEALVRNPGAFFYCPSFHTLRPGFVLGRFFFGGAGIAA